MELKQLLRDPQVTLVRVAEHLEGLDHAGRVRQMRRLAIRDLRAAWRLAADARPVELADILPPGRPGGAPVRHEGWNSVPVPGHFRVFAKVFVGDSKDPGRAVGYNDNALGVKLVGITPGYFVMTPTDPAVGERGAFVVDYHLLPEGDLPQGWPRVVSNGRIPQRFVFHRTMDYLRVVSEHVTVGMPWKGRPGADRCLNMPFLLCREP